eukprot:Sspe_Gene.76103::Locus_47551_Transcript_2_2_Confidence_0.750_Length_873::g.76103::m.76103/K13989/DERL2_3; Derlin-2/3
MAQSFEAWWNSLKPVTKFSICACLFLTITASLDMIHMQHYFLIWPRIFQLGEIWRLPTSLFFLGRFGLPFMFNFAFFIIYQKRLEEETFDGRIADHVWMMVIISIPLFLLGYYFEMFLVSFSFSMSIVWVWCKKNESAMLSFYGFAFKAATFPWILTLIHLLMGGGLIQDVVGILAGHVYVFLKDILPNTHGINLAKTPSFMERLFPPQRIGLAGLGGAQVYVPEARQQQAPNAPHRWGPGRRLDD